MFKVITLNLNGIRSAQRKGFFDWVKQQDADVICVQEIKAQASDIAHASFSLEGYYSSFHHADKKGYSGVGIYSRYKPRAVKTGLGWGCADQEGRYIAYDLDGLWVASLYLPSGTSGPERQTVKFDFLERYAHVLGNILQNEGEYIICGDWNIAHKEIDLKNWRGNRKNSGFLPEERAWLDRTFGDQGFVDGFRVINQEADQYTWWSNRGRAWEKNVGWRIDYQVTTPNLQSKVKSASIYKEQRFSDHSPLTINYDIIF